MIMAAFIFKEEVAANILSAASALLAASGSVVTYITLQDARQEKIYAAMPSVTVDFPFSANGMVHIVVRNTSNVIARNVTLRFDEAPVDFSGRKISEKSWLQNPIDIAPGCQKLIF
jgi:hypothetical protein